MFSIGMQELVIILIIALLVLGPKRLPEVARALGKGVREFKKATREVRESINVEGELRKELKKIEEEIISEEPDEIDESEEDETVTPSKTSTSTQKTTAKEETQAAKDEQK